MTRAASTGYAKVASKHKRLRVGAKRDPRLPGDKVDSGRKR